VWLLCDLDGTLCDHTHRLGYAFRQEWDTYNVLAAHDPVVKPVLEVLQVFAELGEYKIGIITARPDSVKQLTEQWLMTHDVPYDHLVMRSFGDWRSDHIVKLEKAKIYWPPAEVLFVLDDRNGVVEAWRENGYRCFQVAKDTMPQGWTP
jgi:FMN phosphatase YigB (HAD superfamily)